MSKELLIHYQQQWQQNFAKQPAATWLNALRQNALATFLELGIPGPANEQWKYTSLAAFQSQRFTLPTLGNELLTKAVIQKFLLSEQNSSLVFVDGVFSPTLSHVPPALSGLIIVNFAQAIEKQEGLVRNYLEQQKNQNTFAHLNAACMQDGAFIYVPSNFQVLGTVQLLFVSTLKQSMKSIRNVIVVESNAKVNIVEEHQSLHDNPYMSNVVTQIHANEGAHIDYVKLQNQSRQSFHFANTQIHQKQDSTVNLHCYHLGSQLAREDMDCYLQSKGASASLQGLYLPLQHQHIDIHTTIFHEADHTTSEEYFKGVIAQKSRAVFNGKIKVSEHIKQAIANLQNKNLLLTQDCEVNTKPELEIFADDVKCRHGATVGQMDSEMLFYLRSRGIDQEQAYRLLLSAFVNENLNVLPDAQLLEKIKSSVMTHCEVLDHV